MVFMNVSSNSSRFISKEILRIAHKLRDLRLLLEEHCIVWLGLTEVKDTRVKSESEINDILKPFSIKLEMNM